MTPLEAADKRTELKLKIDDYKQKYTETAVRIRARKAALKETGITKSQDVELAKLQNRATLINAKLSQLKLEMAQLPVIPAPEPPKKKKRILPLPGEETSGIWVGLNLFQLKLVQLMITEIGMTRFRELRKLASDDCAGKLAGTEYEPQQVTEEKTQEPPKKKDPYDVDFAKMMRTNYNRFAGDEI